MSEMKAAKICVIGIGYVGLPLAISFARLHHVIGYDLSEKRVDELTQGIDSTNEVEAAQLQHANNLSFTCSVDDIADADIYIVTVPTPVDSFKVPDLSALLGASKAISKVLSKQNIVVFESTVFPGVTEEYCVPELIAGSDLEYNRDFFVGYSPERINPGDKLNRLENITKVVSGSTPESAEIIRELYANIITAGVFLASSIKIAEAAKVIENTQRDVNIALMNELAMLFNKMGLNTKEVLEAAGTKWNFIKFQPGLVGGHCIGVDPYYLTHKARELGFHSEMILSGRRVNDKMGEYVSQQFISLMVKKKINIAAAKVLILGLSFKENCPDVRNSKVTDICQYFTQIGVAFDVYDPVVNPDEAKREMGIDVIPAIQQRYDGILLAVAHDEFLDMGVSKLKTYCREDHVFYDVKGVFPVNLVDGGL